jgi:hypothetical protein
MGRVRMRRRASEWYGTFDPGGESWAKGGSPPQYYDPATRTRSGGCFRNQLATR